MKIVKYNVLTDCNTTGIVLLCEDDKTYPLKQGDYVIVEHQEENGVKCFSNMKIAEILSTEEKHFED